MSGCSANSCSIHFCISSEEMAFCISEHQRCGDRSFRPRKEYEFQHPWPGPYERHLNRHNPCGFFPWFDSRGTNFALRYFKRSLATAFQPRSLPCAQLEICEDIKRFSIAWLLKSPRLRATGQVRLVGSVPNRVPDEDLPVVFD